MDHVIEQIFDPDFLQRITAGVPLPDAELTSAWRCTHCGCVEKLTGSGWSHRQGAIAAWMKREGLQCGPACPTRRA